MNIYRARSGITTIAAILTGLCLAGSIPVAAQQSIPEFTNENATRIEGFDAAQGITWWVIGSGGVLGSGNDRGDLLSATVGQTAIDRASDRSTMTAYLGYWLPEQSSSSTSEASPAASQADNAFTITNHPNPFNSQTVISYRLPSRGRILLRIYDMTGRQVRLLLDAEQLAGDHWLTWDASDDGGGVLSAGVYIYLLELNADGATGASSVTARGMMYLVK